MDIDEDEEGIELEAEETEIEEETVINEAELDLTVVESDDEVSTSNKVTEDPYVLHFERELSPNLLQHLKNPLSSKSKAQYVWSKLEKFVFTYISLQENLLDHKREGTDVDSNEQGFQHPLSLLKKLEKGKRKCNWIDKLPLPPTKFDSDSDQEKELLLSLHLKSQLHNNIIATNKVCTEKEGISSPLTHLQTELLALMGQYSDLYFPRRTFGNEVELRNAYCFHVANHITKLRNRILHHNAKMLHKTEVPDEFRDQGFVRPKVLILVPFKESALRVVKTLISTFLHEEKGSVQNKKRFINEFGGETLFMPKTNPKPEDYMASFAGNIEDNFKIGLAVTKKSLKLYTGFYSSDIIIASPLGLRLIIGAEGERNRDYDFLSSIEVLIMDQADIFLMQSWDHILHLMQHIHLQPVTTHGTDFSRIRPWAVDGHSRFYLQTLIFSSVVCPEHHSLLSKHCKNFAGQAKLLNTVISGSISQIMCHLPQVFHQFTCETITEANDARFHYFVDKILPNFSGKLMSHTLIFVSSYFDFVRLRNYFKKEEKSFVQICEYTKDKKIARARDLFFHGKSHFFLYTERAHFFRRLRLKGVGHIIFYQLPQYPHFYSELCNFIREDFQSRRVRQRKNSSVNVLYCKYDVTRLAAVTGDERCQYMLSSSKNVHAFVSGS